MASFLSHLSPIPAFPAYTGPYKVGTQDVEIPVSELSSPSPAFDNSISTISFRIFYPCEPVKHPKHVYWFPDPQGQYFRAYARFLSASPRLASFFSYLPIFRTIFHTTIPALRDAKLAAPPESVGKWPVMVFSHGLGGSRNAYSHITGSLASHGMVVVAAEHRDGSAPISFIRHLDRSPPTAIDYASLPHKPSPEVEEKRNEQLKIRLWELGLIHDALLRLTEGKNTTNIADDKHQNIADQHGFTSALDVHTPGKISWPGHSFGAATVVQFVKSVYYPTPRNQNGYQALYTSSADSAITKQITPSSPHFTSLGTAPSFPNDIMAPREAYAGLQQCERLSALGSPERSILQMDEQSAGRETRHLTTSKAKDQSHSTDLLPRLIRPSLPIRSGPLFPWLTKKVFKADNPERTLRLKIRAILENLRRSGIKVANTSDVDMELSSLNTSGAKELEGKQAFPLGQDHQILEADGSVKGWVAVPLSGRNGVANANGHAIEAEGPNEAVMEGEVMKE